MRDEGIKEIICWLGNEMKLKEGVAILFWASVVVSKWTSLINVSILIM